MPRALLVVCLVWHGAAFAQDLEPRRWTHMPVGTSVGGLSYVYTDGDLSLDPVLEISNAKVEAHTAVAGYTHAFECLGRTARLDLIVPYTSARWDGLLSGAPASTRRRGLADPWLRLSIGLVGAPALRGKEYMGFRAARPVHTVVGAGVGVMFPVGEYDEDKLLNLGQNRFVFRPQAGVVHTRGPWSYELTSSVYLFTENDDFFGGNEREQDPLYAVQTHVIHTFANRWWGSVSAGYSFGGESEINGVSKDDERGDLLTAISFGLPVGETQAVKLVYLRGDTQERVGSDTNSLMVSWSLRL